MAIIFVYKKISHHAAHSGYDQLPKYVPSRDLNPRATAYLTQFLGKVSQKRLEKLLMPQAGGWYKTEFLAQEIQSAVRMAFRSPFKKDVYHYLYGEDAFRWGAPRLIKGRSRIAVTFHQPPDIFKDVIKDNVFARRADAVIVCGTNQIDYFEKITGRRNVFFVPHGIDTDFFTPTTCDTDGRFNTISVGWWLRDVEMIKTIATRAGELGLNMVFHIVTFPQYFDFYKGLTNVRLYSGISDEELRDTYRRSDALLLPLKDSTANNAVLEAMACGKPILTTDVGGVRDYVNDRFGFLAKPGDHRYLLDALIDLSKDPVTKQKMGSAAREKSLEFGWTNIARQMVDVYRQL